MMRLKTSVAFGLLFTQTILCQTLDTALQAYPQASTFQRLLKSIPGGLTSIAPSSPQGLTVLVPDNGAIDKFVNASGLTDVTQFPSQLLLAYLQYHIMAAKLTSANFSAPNGLIVPTLLKDQQYNNRTAGAELTKTYGADAASGQVIYISKNPISPVKFRIRQSTTNFNLRGGSGEGASLDPVNGQWEKGSFHIIGSVLIPPEPCTATMNNQGHTLSSLYAALNKTGLSSVLDTAPNVTCLAPSNSAFSAAGNPQQSLGNKDLSAALLFHTLPLPLYSPYITGCTQIASVNGTNVTVEKVGDDIYFNDAKIISPNVLTNNGLIHVLDKVMSSNGTAPGSTCSASSSATLSPSPSTASPTSSPSQTTVPHSVACSTSVSASAVTSLVIFFAIGLLLF